MEENDDTTDKNDPSRTIKILSAVEAAILEHDEQLKEIRDEIKSIRGESRNVIIGVLIATVLIVATVSIELMVYHTRDNSSIKDFQREYYREIEELRQNQKSADEMTLEIKELRKRIDELQKKENQKGQRTK